MFHSHRNENCTLVLRPSCSVVPEELQHLGDPPGGRRGVSLLVTQGRSTLLCDARSLVPCSGGSQLCDHSWTCKARLGLVSSQHCMAAAGIHSPGPLDAGATTVTQTVSLGWWGWGDLPPLTCVYLQAPQGIPGAGVCVPPPHHVTATNVRPSCGDTGAPDP